MDHMNYRERCYKAYGLVMGQIHSYSEEEFEFYLKINKKRYGRFLPVDKTSDILDIACGAGAFLYLLKKEGYVNGHGIDFSKDQLDAAKRMGITNAEEADFFDYLPAHPGKYEMIFANDIIEHLTKDEVLKFLDLIYSALKPGGKAIIGTVNGASLFSARFVYGDFTHEQCFTPASLVQVLRVCSFENVSIYGESPIAHDFKSRIRKTLWEIMKKFIYFYLSIEGGTGRGLRKQNIVLEPRMFAVGRRGEK